jgi:ABC-type bacteriocin/lantibiotic exporter with double-glycine peptidase domain
MSDVLAPAMSLGAPPRPTDWNEAVWLDRLTAAIGHERMAISSIASALPRMLVALGWRGTGRSLAALLPPPDEPVSLADVEQLLPEIGFCSRRFTARGAASDTERLHAGSLALRGETSAVYLGQPDGLDRWLADGEDDAFELTAGDLVLAIDPDPNFHAADEPRSNWFRGLFERLRDDLFAVLAMSAFINVLALAVSVFTLVVYSTVIPANAPDAVWGVALVTAVVAIASWALRIGRQIVLSRMSIWAGTRIGEAAMRKMLSFSFDVSSRPGIQNNVIRMRSFENARQFLSGVGGTYLIDYPFVVIFILVIALMGGWLVLVPLVSLLCFCALAVPTADYVSSKGAAAGLAAGRVEEQAGAAFLGINAFYHAGAGSQWLGRFADQAREAANRNRDYAIAVARAQAIGQALGQLTVLATMCVGVMLVFESAMTAGGLMAAMMLIWRIVVPAQQGFGSLVRLRQIRSSVNQLDQLMATPSERAGVEIASPAGIVRATITVDRLYYRAAADQEAALNGVSFTAPAGKRLAIVGPNAGGKTALLECLAGLRRPQSGRVLIDGRDTRQFDAKEYRAWIGYVPQAVPALPLTIRDFLRLRHPALRDDEAIAAFQRLLGPQWRRFPGLVCAPDPLLDRELNPFSEENAEMKLRHLVAFVAATLGDPTILLLDGVGFGGDPAWDEIVANYLDSIRGRTTVIWAPYSTAQIQSSDHLVILERGNVRHAGPTAKAG